MLSVSISVSSASLCSVLIISSHRFLTCCVFLSFPSLSFSHCPSPAYCCEKRERSNGFTVRMSRFHWCFIITGLIKAIRHIQNVSVFIIGVVLECLIKIYTYEHINMLADMFTLEWVIFCLCAALCKHVYTKNEFVGHKNYKFVQFYVQQTHFKCYIPRPKILVTKQIKTKGQLT